MPHDPQEKVTAFSDATRTLTTPSESGVPLSPPPTRSVRRAYLVRSSA
jgi:hypothetical protein